jgi:hypothetical protein
LAKVELSYTKIKMVYCMKATSLLVLWSGVQTGTSKGCLPSVSKILTIMGQSKWLLKTKIQKTCGCRASQPAPLLINRNNKCTTIKCHISLTQHWLLEGPIFSLFFWTATHKVITPSN